MMRVAMLVVLAGLSAATAAADEAARVEASRWRVTKGRIEALPDGKARVVEPKMRAVVPQSDGNEVEIRFDYDGPTAEAARLGSGELRRQVGLKLRAADGCNLLYVMWRIEPRADLVVSVKRNPGRHTHRECGTNGYQNLKAAAGLRPTAAMAPGSHHALHAKLDGSHLRVWADKALAWEGDVDVGDLHGPVGMRTDNARVTVELRARAGAERASEGDED